MIEPFLLETCEGVRTSLELYDLHPAFPPSAAGEAGEVGEVGLEGEVGEVGISIKTKTNNGSQYAIPRRSMGLPYMPISWGGLGGLSGAAYIPVPWSVCHICIPRHDEWDCQTDDSAPDRPPFNHPNVGSPMAVPWSVRGL